MVRGRLKAYGGGCLDRLSLEVPIEENAFGHLGYLGFTDMESQAGGKRLGNFQKIHSFNVRRIAVSLFHEEEDDDRPNVMENWLHSMTIGTEWAEHDEAEDDSEDEIIEEDHQDASHQQTERKKGKEKDKVTLIDSLEMNMASQNLEILTLTDGTTSLEKKIGRPYPMRMVIFTFLHELAHSVTPLEMSNKNEHGRSKRRHWVHHDHNEDFYENFERILKAAEELDILRLGKGLNRKKVKRIDGFEVPGILDFVKLGSAVPRWMLEDKDAFNNLSFVFGLGPSPLGFHSDGNNNNNNNTKNNTVQGSEPTTRVQEQPMRLQITYPSKGKALFIVTRNDLQLQNLRHLVVNKFKAKKKFVFLRHDGLPLITEEEIIMALTDPTSQEPSHLIVKEIKL